MNRDEGRAITRRAADLTLAAALLVLAGVLYAETRSDIYQHTGLGTAFNAVFYPRILLAILALLAVALIAQALLVPAGRFEAGLSRHVVPVGGTVGLTILYGAVFTHVPFVVAAALYGAAVALILGYRRFYVLAATAIAVPLFLALIFEGALGVRLP